MWNTKEMSQLDAVLTGVPLTLTFDLEFPMWNCISGMGGPIVIMVMEQKGQELIGSWTLTSPMTLTLDFCLIFNVGQFLRNERPHWHGTKRTGGMGCYTCYDPLSDLEAEDTVRDWGDFIARTHWCVPNDSETHETVLLDCTTGEAGSAIQLHQSSAFHCHFAHTSAFSLLSHTYCVQTELRWLLSNEWKVTRSYIFFKFAICSIALLSLGETCHLKRSDMVTGVADGAVAKLLHCASTHQHYDVMRFEYVVWQCINGLNEYSLRKF